MVDLKTKGHLGTIYLDNTESFNLNDRKAGDNSEEGSDMKEVDLLIKNLKMEEDHEDWGEIQESQIEQMGLQDYLSNQV